MLGFLKGLLHRSDRNVPVRNESVHVTRTISESDHLDHHIKALREGAVWSLSWVYQYIANYNDYLVRRAAVAVAEYVSQLDTGSWIRLNDRFRMTTSIEWMVNWKNVDPEKIKRKIDDTDAFVWIMRLGTMHPNGFYREKCLRMLSSDTGSYLFFLLRLNDWVEEVRDVARDACRNICTDNMDLSYDELIRLLPVLNRVRNGKRKDEDLMQELDPLFASALRAKLPSIDRAFIRKYDTRTRVVLYRLFTANGQLSKEDILSLLDIEKNLQIQRLLATSLIRHHDLSTEELDGLIAHKSSVVRVAAMDKKYEILKAPWDGIEEKLLSPSGPVRQTARFICRKHSYVDVRQYYIDHLDSDQRAESILGLAETGKKEDADLLTAYLEDEAPRVVKNTLYALGELDALRYIDVFERFLKDKDITVVKQAYVAMTVHKLKIGAENIYNMFQETDSHYLKARLSVLLGHEAYWDRIPYALMMYSCEDEEILRHIDVTCAWDSRNVSDERLGWISSILKDDSYKIPEKVKEYVEFNIRSVRR